MTTHLLIRSRISLIKSLNPYHGANSAVRAISTTPFLSQEPQLAAEATHPDTSAPPASSTPLPPNPATGSPIYQENWRNPIPNSPPSLSQSLIPLGLLNQSSSARIRSLSQSLDLDSLLNLFAGWTTTKSWSDMKELFDFWIRTLDKNGKPNKPDVNLYNHYLRANLMLGASADYLLDLVEQMGDFEIKPNTASFNLVLKAMHQARETDAAQMLLERMLEIPESLPDDESYDLVIGLLFETDQIDAALKNIDVALKSGYMLSTKVFMGSVHSCVAKGRIDTLVSIIERCKNIDRNKALCPPWNVCSNIAEAAFQADSSKLAYHSLDFMAKWIVRGEMARPPTLLSVDEGLIVSALGTAARTNSPSLLDASWAILKRSLRQIRAPNPESYLAKINAYASLGNLERAFSTLKEFESAYGNSEKEVAEEMFSPFTSLFPLVVACSKKGFETLDKVYFQLENLSRADPPYKSVAALNCIILGCANVWDLDRAYQTFEAITGFFGLTPDIHSYNALLCAFGKLKKTFEATKVFEHLISIGVKPDTRTYSLLVDAHLVNRDPQSAVSIINDMISAGFVPTKETLKKVRRRCIRELDYENDDRVESLARQLQIRMGTENRRNFLFNLDYSTGLQS